MLEVSEIIWQTCKSYLAQQGKFLIILWVLIAICMVYYFMGLSHAPFGNMIIILLASILGILGSYGVAWFGMRINTRANSRPLSLPPRETGRCRQYTPYLWNERRSSPREP